MKQIISRVGGLNKKIIFENKILFFSTFRKITVGGFVNQLIKKFWPKFSYSHLKCNVFNFYVWHFFYCLVYLLTLLTNACIEANSVDPDPTAAV